LNLGSFVLSLLAKDGEQYDSLVTGEVERDAPGNLRQIEAQFEQAIAE
jgi:hypothetical protein